MKSIASVLSIIALGFGLLGCPGSGGGGGSSTSAFAVSTTSANFGVVDNVYTSTLATTGGTAPFTWTLFSGALPTGLPNLSLDPATGVVSGTPTVVGNFNATFTVKDSTGQTATGSVLFAVHPRTDLVSIDNSIPPVPGGGSSSPSISDDGRFVAFASSATLILGVVGSQIYIHDWQTNQTSLVSQNAVGTAGNGTSSQPTISSNGQFVAFTSLAANLAATPGGSGTQIFLRDTQTNTTALVSRVGLGNAGDGASSQPTISPNGQFVAFTSLAANLAATPGGSGTQIFLRDTQTNTTALVSRVGLGNAGDGASSQPTISGDGRFVAFTSDASNLTTDTNPAQFQIFLRDTVGNGTSLVSKDNSSPPVPGDGLSNAPSANANGGFVAFSSLSTNLGATGGNQIYVRAIP